MHLVFLNQYYPPDDAPTGVMLKDVAQRLVEEGHEVTVICSQSGYTAGTGNSSAAITELNDGFQLRIVRLPATRFGRESSWRKLLDYVLFYAGVTWVLVTMGRPPDRIVALTTPPYLSLLARFVSKLRAGDHAHWVMDIYPDVMTAHGMMRKTSLGYRVLAALARTGFGGNRCAAILTLGPDMAETIDGNLVSSPNVTWVPLWSGCQPRSSSYHELRRKRGWGEKELIVMYSGNMGLGHRFQEILKLIRNLEIPEAERRATRFVFFGRGKRRGEIETFINAHPDTPVELHDYASADDLGAHLQSADVHLVSLDTAWTGTMLPSKLQGSFAAGRPAIFIGSSESSIGRWIEESGGGWVVEPDDTRALIAALEESRDADTREIRGANARSFAESHFNKERNSALVATILAGN